MAIKYWVNDKTRKCQVTMNIDDKEVIGQGFREVTVEEQERFQEETQNLKKAKKKK